MDRAIAGILEKTGLPADRLEIEVPEKFVLKPSPAVMETLGRIKGLGVRVAMDDFGASYSSLASIAHFPFDKIKIDKKVLRRPTRGGRRTSRQSSPRSSGSAAPSASTLRPKASRTTISMVTLLKAAGCSIVQGFLFGMPKRDARAPLLPEGKGAAQRADEG